MDGGRGGVERGVVVVARWRQFKSWVLACGFVVLVWWLLVLLDHMCMLSLTNRVISQ